jgi:hypothetical protein
MNYYDLTVPQLIHTLRQIPRWLDKAEAYAGQKKFDVQVLLDSRLATDQYNFLRQVQVACRTAKNFTASLAGQEVPKFEENEKTVADLRARVEQTIAWLETLRPEHFEGAEDRAVELPFTKEKRMKGSDYLFQFLLPNFYFHTAAAYAILRHNGLELGKRDFLGDITLRDA